MYWLKSCSVLIILCAFVACHPSKKLTTTTAPSGSPQVAFAWAQPQWLALRGDVDYADPSFQMGFSVNVRYRRDSIIWLNASKFGFEAVRALITKDTVYILNHMEKTAIVRPLSYIEQQFGIPASFPEIEKLLLGGPPSLEGADSVSIMTDSVGWKVRAATPVTDISCITDASSRMTNMLLKKRGTRLYLAENLSQFEKMGSSYTFPMQRFIEAFTTERGQSSITVKFSDPEADVPKTIRFEVPAHYQRI